ncbi:hypothetical protein BGX31_011554 [Mortierella sp. GBA43]|nr:hypothetical protein BGX31_011554 [Mortierella sp. GBA43]
MAQELLLTFGNTIGELSLIPGKSATFIVRVNGDVVFDRKDHGRFPEMKEVKQLVRGVIAPEMNLGHSDSAVKSAISDKDQQKSATEGSTATTTPEATATVQHGKVEEVTSTSDAADDDSTAHPFDCKTCV